MKQMRHLAVAAATLLAGNLALAEVKVGVTVAVSGPGASLGIPARNALALWPKEVGGEKLVVQLLDDAGDPALATKNAKRFISDNVDVIVGAANTPASLAIHPVITEAGVPQLTLAPIELPSGRDPWTFRAVMDSNFYAEGIIEHMKRAGVKSLAFLGLSDAYGETWLQAMNKHAAKAGIKVVAAERFTRADTSVAGQALKAVASRPDAIFVVAIGGGAALPQKAIKDRGYRGKIYHSPTSVSGDFLRLAGKDAEGALVISGPEQVPEQLPAKHPARQTALKFVQEYESKYGPGSRTQFAAHIYDFGLVLQSAIPVALKKAKPGTPEFRQALKDALERSGGIMTTKGVLNYGPADHWGRGVDSRVMLAVQGGQWKLVD